MRIYSLWQLEVTTSANSATEVSLEIGVDGIRELSGTDGLEVSQSDQAMSVVVSNVNFIGLAFRLTFTTAGRILKCSRARNMCR